MENTHLGAYSREDYIKFTEDGKTAIIDYDKLEKEFGIPKEEAEKIQNLIIPILNGDTEGVIRNVTIPDESGIHDIKGTILRLAAAFCKGEAFKAVYKATDENYANLKEKKETNISHTYINDKDKNDYTPLLIAAKDGNLENLKFLLSEPNVDITVKTKDGLTIHELACLSGNLEMVKYVFENYPYSKAPEKKEKKEIRNKPSQMQFENPILNKPTTKNTSVRRYKKIEQKPIDYALECAIKSNNPKVINYLLGENDKQEVIVGIKEGDFESTIKTGNIEIIDCFIKKGFDFNKEYRFDNNSIKETPLEYAIGIENIEVIKQLINETKIYPILSNNIGNKNENCINYLDIAIKTGNKEIFDIIKENYSIELQKSENKESLRDIFMKNDGKSLALAMEGKNKNPEILASMIKELEIPKDLTVGVAQGNKSVIDVLYKDDDFILGANNAKDNFNLLQLKETRKFREKVFKLLGGSIKKIEKERNLKLLKFFKDNDIKPNPEYYNSLESEIKTGKFENFNKLRDKVILDCRLENLYKKGLIDENRYNKLKTSAGLYDVGNDNSKYIKRSESTDLVESFVKVLEEFEEVKRQEEEIEKIENRLNELKKVLTNSELVEDINREENELLTQKEKLIKLKQEYENKIEKLYKVEMPKSFQGIEKAQNEVNKIKKQSLLNLGKSETKKIVRPQSQGINNRSNVKTTKTKRAVKTAGNTPDNSPADSPITSPTISPSSSSQVLSEASSLESFESDLNGTTLSVQPPKEPNKEQSSPRRKTNTQVQPSEEPNKKSKSKLKSTTDILRDMSENLSNLKDDLEKIREENEKVKQGSPKM